MTDDSAESYRTAQARFASFDKPPSEFAKLGLGADIAKLGLGSEIAKLGLGSDKLFPRLDASGLFPKFDISSLIEADSLILSRVNDAAMGYEAVPDAVPGVLSRGSELQGLSLNPPVI